MIVDSTRYHLRVPGTGATLFDRLSLSPGHGCTVTPTVDSAWTKALCKKTSRGRRYVVVGLCSHYSIPSSLVVADARTY